MYGRSFSELRVIRGDTTESGRNKTLLVITIIRLSLFQLFKLNSFKKQR
jgi:hypothetical protein